MFSPNNNCCWKRGNVIAKFSSTIFNEFEKKNTTKWKIITQRMPTSSVYFRIEQSRSQVFPFISKGHSYIILLGVLFVIYRKTGKNFEIYIEKSKIKYATFLRLLLCLCHTGLSQTYRCNIAGALFMKAIPLSFTTSHLLDNVLFLFMCDFIPN